jgi:hypothetical protein
VTTAAWSDSPRATTCALAAGGAGVCDGLGTCVACASGADCSPKGGCSPWTIHCDSGGPVCLPASTSVPDGTSCGQGGSCRSGVCETPCTNNVGTRTCPEGVCLDDGSCARGCFIDGAFYGPAQASPTNDCMVCMQQFSTSSFIPAGAGTPCALAGGPGTCDAKGACRPSCVAGADCAPPGGCLRQAIACPSSGDAYCGVGGPAATGTPCGTMGACLGFDCVSGCEISGAHYNWGQVNPGNDCQSCQPLSSLTSWANLPNGAVCGPSGAGTCDAGSCK